MDNTVAILTDTHFGARSDSSIFLDNFEEFFSKTFFPTLKQRKIKNIIHLGDLVDRRKYINFQTLHRMRKSFLDPMAENGIKMHIILGNHDVMYHHTSDINAIEELIFLRYNNITYYQNPIEVQLFGKNVLFLPWINESNSDRSLYYLQNSTANLCMGHLEIQGFPMNDSEICTKGIPLEMFDKFDYTFSGHFHQKSHNNNIHYLGAPYEMTFGDMGFLKGFHIFDFDSYNLEFIKNDHNIFRQLVYNDSLPNATHESVVKSVDFSQYTGKYVKLIVSSKNEPYWFEKFKEKLDAVQPADVKVIDLTDVLIDVLKTDNLEVADTTTVLKNSIMSMGDYTPEYKQRLSSKIVEIYTEALADNSNIID